MQTVIARATPVLLALALFFGLDPVFAAHVYATVPGGIHVYEVAANGSLTLRQVLPGAGGLMAVTPGGRFLYTAGDQTITEYAAQPDGTLRQQGTPLFTRFRGWGDAAMHPSGDYLFLVDVGFSEAVWAYSTGDVDGHLTLIGGDYGSIGVGVKAESVAADPDGEFVFGGSEYACPPGHLTSIRVGPGGTMTAVGSAETPSVLKKMVADSRFLYVQGRGSACSNPEGISVFSIMRDRNRRFADAGEELPGRGGADAADRRLPGARERAKPFRLQDRSQRESDANGREAHRNLRYGERQKLLGQRTLGRYH